MVRQRLCPAVGLQRMEVPADGESSSGRCIFWKVADGGKRMAEPCRWLDSMWRKQQMAAAVDPSFRAPGGVRTGSAACRVTCVFVSVLRLRFQCCGCGWWRLDGVAVVLDCGGCGDLRVDAVLRGGVTRGRQVLGVNWFDLEDNAEESGRRREQTVGAVELLRWLVVYGSLKLTLPAFPCPSWAATALTAVQWARSAC